MISSTHNFIYLHVPKTGGNSIQTLLQPLSDDDFVLQGHQDGRDRFGIRGTVTPHKHALLSDYASALGQDLYRYNVIISVRDPLERAISFYFSPHRWYALESATGAYARQEVYWSLDGFKACLKEIVPMVDFLKVNGKPVKPDQVIRFENLSRDFERCAAVIGLENMQFPHTNKSASKELALQAMADRKVRQLVADTFALDHDFFAYAVR